MNETLKIIDAIALVNSGHKFVRADVFMSSVRNWLVTIHDDNGRAYTLRPALSAEIHFKSLKYVVNSTGELGIPDDEINVSISSKVRRPVKITDSDIDVLNSLDVLSDIATERTKDGYRVVGLVGEEKVPFFVFNVISDYRRKKAYSSREGAILFARRKGLPGFRAGETNRDSDLDNKDEISFRRSARLVREGKLTDPVIQMTPFGEWETFGTYMKRKVKLLPLVKPKVKTVSYVSPARAVNHMLNLGFPRYGIKLIGNKDAEDYHYAVTEKAAIAFLYCGFIEKVKVIKDEEKGYQVVLESKTPDEKFVVASTKKSGNKRAVPYMKKAESINAVLERIGSDISV